MFHFQEQDIGTSPEDMSMTTKKGCRSSVVYYIQQVDAYNIVFFWESIGQIITTTIPGGLN